MLNCLSYPLDIDFILRKKKSIKKELLECKKELIIKKIAILGGSTTNLIKDVLELFLINNGIQPIFYESDYNKYYEEALFDSENLNNFKPDIIYIHTSNLNIIDYPNYSDDLEGVQNKINSVLSKYEQIWKSLEKFDCAIIQNNFDYPYYRSLGNLDSYSYSGKTFFLNNLNLEFSKKANEIKNLYLNDINYLSSKIGLESWFDKSLWYRAKYAISYDGIVHLSSNLSKIICAIFGKTKKCLVLDLDNTCWGGVIGDDGLTGISIGKETAIGETFTKFQEYAKELKDRGIMLAVCSKNDFKNAKEGFLHPDTILKFEDFTSFKANWDPKYLNILEIAKEINIGLDSLVFIDDNPMEREIVSKNIDSISVPNVGEDVINFIDYIDNMGYFETISLSNDDINRNKYYEDNKKRVEEESKFISYENFLESLEMHAEIESFNDIYLDRITQLTNKTNQFNLTTKRYTNAEMEEIKNNEQYIKLYGKLNDKFGDNGLISIVIGSIDKSILHIDLWLMSCRVLKRDMEYAMLDELVKKAKEKNITKIKGYFYQTPKNSMVKLLFKDFGFDLVEEKNESSIWELDINNYKNKNKYIKVN